MCKERVLSVSGGKMAVNLFANIPGCKDRGASSGPDHDQDLRMDGLKIPTYF
jgi:hypothetical protein